METILKTTLLEFEKSSFLIDLVKHDSGRQFICINQTIQDEETNNKRTLKINPSVLTELLKVLKTYQSLIPDIKEKNQTKQASQATETKKVSARTFVESEKEAIINRYLKGISIDDLSMQFDCKSALIEQVLRNNDIEIVDNNLPKLYNYKKYRQKKN